VLGVSVGINALNSRISDISVSGAFIDSMVTRPSTVRSSSSLPRRRGRVPGCRDAGMTQFGIGAVHRPTAQQAALVEIVKGG
jgi:hypothetical protein